MKPTTATDSRRPRNIFRTNRATPLISALLRFDTIALAGLGGLVAVGIVVAVVSPPVGVSHAPRASLDLESVLRLEPVPTARVAVTPLAAPSVNAGPTVAEVSHELAYDLALVADGDTEVPRVFLPEMPTDLHAVPEVSDKKDVFFKSVLPLVLRVNEELSKSRKRLKSIAETRAQGGRVSAQDRLWLAMMSDRYDTKRDDLTALLRRVDIIPPSLALAQAAKESGWGTSRFTQQGNALFGQWTWSRQNGLVPEQRDDGKDHLVRHFDNLLDSVRAYMLNLNTHRAYRELRKLRADMRAQGEPLDGQALALGLKHYSEMGMEYVHRIQAMIDYNQLSGFDSARLEGAPSQS